MSGMQYDIPIIFMATQSGTKQFLSPCVKILILSFEYFRGLSFWYVLWCYKTMYCNCKLWTSLNVAIKIMFYKDKIERAVNMMETTILKSNNSPDECGNATSDIVHTKAPSVR